MSPQVVVFPLFAALLTGCGGTPIGVSGPLGVGGDPGGPRCASPHGKYDAVYTLRETDGTCDKAKKESHDPMQFDDQGNYLSPVDGLIKCETSQSGCRVVVRCTTDALPTAEADLDATLTADGSELSGVGTVVGSYQGCHKVVYEVHAKRAAQ